jgi:cell division protein FtsB
MPAVADPVPAVAGEGRLAARGGFEAQVNEAHRKNAELIARNAKLDSEVRDLKDGTGAVEERARYELSMIKQNEIFVQIVGKGQAAALAPLAPKPAEPPEH